MMKPKLRHLPLAAAALVTCMSAHAGYQSPDGSFSLSGFGTLGFAKTTTKDASYNYPGQGVGVKTTPGITPDSKVAAQGTYRFAPTFSATAQILSKANAYGDFEPALEWAFAKWQAAPALSFRAGRMGVPLFAISDFREVAYANTWVRPPLDVYGQVPVSNFEGADATYQVTLGSVTLTSSMFYGDAKAKYALTNPKSFPPTDVEIKHMLGLNIQGETDNGFTFRLGRMSGKLSVNSQTGALIQSGSRSVLAGIACVQAYSTSCPVYSAGLAAMANAGSIAAFNSAIDLLNVNGEKASFTGLGMGYDNGTIVTNLEFTKRKTESYVADSTGWYASLGYRLGKYTPYVAYGKLKADRNDANPLSANATIRAVAAGSATIGGLVSGLQQSLNTQLMDEKTTTLGVRWEAANGLAVKGQWDRINKPANSSGLFFSPNTSFVSEAHKVDVLSVSVDFVF